MQVETNTLRRAVSAIALAGALALAAGCHSNSVSASGPDPAQANLAPANGQTQVLAIRTPRIRRSSRARRIRSRRLHRSSRDIRSRPTRNSPATSPLLTSRRVKRLLKRPLSRLRSCPNMISRPRRVLAISGPPATGLGGLTATTGFRAPGLKRRTMVRFGPHPIGAGTTAATGSTTDIGGGTSATTVASTMALGISASATSAATGAATASTTTAP